MSGNRVSDTFPAAGLESARPASGLPRPAFYSATDTGRIWRSSDGGATWVLYGYALPAGAPASDGYVPKWDNTNSKYVLAVAGSGGSSALLAIATATTSASYSTASATSVAMDATNLSVTFAAPTSGSVYITQSAYSTTNSATAGAYEWSVITTGGADVSVCSVIAKENNLARRTAHHYITGLTAGTSYTYRWGHRVSGAITGSSYTGGNSGTNGNTIMTVQAV